MLAQTARDFMQKDILPKTADILKLNYEVIRETMRKAGEIGRVVKPDGVLVITFSNRCFPTKAVGPWLYLDDQGHLEFVAGRIRSAH